MRPLRDFCKVEYLYVAFEFPIHENLFQILDVT
jgi:hypothetical protein